MSAIDIESAIEGALLQSRDEAQAKVAELETYSKSARRECYANALAADILYRLWKSTPGNMQDKLVAFNDMREVLGKKYNNAFKKIGPRHTDKEVLTDQFSPPIVRILHAAAKDPENGFATEWSNIFALEADAVGKQATALTRRALLSLSATFFAAALSCEPDDPHSFSEKKKEIVPGLGRVFAKPVPTALFGAVALSTIDHIIMAIESKEFAKKSGEEIQQAVDAARQSLAQQIDTHLIDTTQKATKPLQR